MKISSRDPKKYITVSVPSSGQRYRDRFQFNFSAEGTIYVEQFGNSWWLEFSVQDKLTAQQRRKVTPRARTHLRVCKRTWA